MNEFYHWLFRPAGRDEWYVYSIFRLLVMLFYQICYLVVVRVGSFLGGEERQEAAEWQQGETEERQEIEWQEQYEDRLIERGG